MKDMAEGAAAESLADLLTPLLEPAYVTAWCLTGNSRDAGDLLQEATRRACRDFPELAPGTRFRPWFFRILIESYDSRRGPLRRKPQGFELNDIPEFFLQLQTVEAGLHGGTADPVRVLMQHFEAEDLQMALAALPEPAREITSAYFAGDLTYQDLAEVFAVSLGTVRARLHRGRLLLQPLLWRLAEEKGIAALLPVNRVGALS